MLSGAGVKAPWHGVLETVRLHCNKVQQVVRWCRVQESSHNWQGVVEQIPFATSNFLGNLPFFKPCVRQ